MKILFAYTNINGFHADSFGDGIAMIMAVTKRAGHNIRQIQIFKKSEYSQLELAVKEFKPDMVGFTAVSSQWSFVLEMAEVVKKISPKTINVCGGVHTTLEPECIVNAKNMDAIFVGDSEFSFLEFLKKIENKESWKDVDNVAYDDNGKLKKNKLKPLLTNEELELLPYPDRSTYPFPKVLEHVGFAPFHFTRGCPFVCTYCSNVGLAKIYGKTRYNIRQPSPEHCIREIEETVKQYPIIGPIYKISITDDIFGLNKKWRREFLAIYRERIKIPFACALRCDVVTEETMKDLAKGYCDTIQFGVESGNDYIRNVVMDKEMPRDRIVNAFKLCKKYGIKSNSLNIIGVPGETKEMMMDTVKLNREIEPWYSGAYIFYPYKGTPLGDKSFNEGLVNEKKYRDFSNERRESVMNYPEETLKRLKYYAANWHKEIYPFFHERRFGFGISFYRLKQKIKKIPIVGPKIATQYHKIRRNLH